MTKSKPIGGGRWLPTPPAEHECKPPPVVWGAKAGQRWQCARPVCGPMVTGTDPGDAVECGKIWIVRSDGGRKAWAPEVSRGPEIHVFREASDSSIRYWLADELGDLVTPTGLHRSFLPEDLLTALRKHFTIGVQQ